MCGIVGYIGYKNAQEVILNGLKTLEYRGYDSSGICIYNGNLVTEKSKGKLEALSNKLNKSPITGNLGIGHTRWATHGEPSDINAHPHLNKDGTIAVVHNGIIENYLELKDELIQKGYNFISQTDTEVIAHLLDMFYEGNLLDALYKTTSKLVGAYALVVVAKDSPNEIVAVRKDSPLVVGITKDGYIIASDIPAMIEYTKEVFLLDNNEFIRATNTSLEIFNSQMKQVEKEKFLVTWDADKITKGGFDHFMLKEIHEQPEAIKNTIAVNMKKEEFLPDLQFPTNIDQIYIIACGTSYFAGITGGEVIEEISGIPVRSALASEFRYRKNLINKNTLVIVLSQSGETADTLMAIKHAKSYGSVIWGIVNVLGSSIAREVDKVFYTQAGPEISVASTKAYTTQLILCYMIALRIAKQIGKIDSFVYNEIAKEIKSLPEKVAKTIEKYDDKYLKNIKDIANFLSNKNSVFYMGRNKDYFVSQEGALKLKEISYIHAEAIAAGELKHGSIALITDTTPVIAMATQSDTFEKMISNIKEVKARGAFVIALAKDGAKNIDQVADRVLSIPSCSDIFTPILSVVPLQLLAYYTALVMGKDVDKPRNLAKSVTVE